MTVTGILARVAYATAWGSTLIVLSAGAMGIRGVVSESMPRGLYRSEPYSGNFRRGDTVEVCLPQAPARLARERGYLSSGVFCSDGTQRIAKAVLAIPGDTVIVTREGFIIGGAVAMNTRALEKDSQGRPLRRIPIGIYLVETETLWLFSTESPNSYDSRYFGAIPRSSVRRRYHPLWTERHRGRPVVFNRR